MKGKSEKSQIYCSFFNNVGSCMHGEACSKIHVRPNISKTILLSNLYPNPQKFISMLPEQTLIIETDTLARNFDEFYIDLYEELRMYGPIEDLLVAGNLCDHLVGNVLVRFVDELDAVNALEDLQHRFYAGRPIDAQFSPVENLQESTCKQYFTNECKHGDNCNFIHPMYPSDYVLKECQLSQAKNESHYSLSSANDKDHGDDRKRSRSRDRNYDIDKDNDRRRDRYDSRKSRDDSPSKDRNHDRRYRGDSPSRDRNYRSNDRDDRSYRNDDRDDRNYRNSRSNRDDRNDRSYRNSDRDDRNDRDRDRRDHNDRNDRDRRDRNDDRDRSNRDRGSRNDRDRGNRDRDDDRDRDYRNDRGGNRDRNDRNYRNSERDRNPDRNDKERGNRDRNERDRDNDNNNYDRGDGRDYDESLNSGLMVGYTRTRGYHSNHY